MSLLVINSANRISQGLIKSLQQSNKFERIVCADIYPSYTVHQKWFRFLEELPTSSKTKVSDFKIEEKSDLVHGIRNSTHVLYVTHDYYNLVFSKLTMVVNAAKIVHESPNVKKFVTVNPIEHYHYGEQNAFEAHFKAEEEARKVHEPTVSVQSDLVFGPYSTVVRNIISRLSNGRELLISSSKQEVNPIHCDNLAEIVQGILTGETSNASVVAKGGEVLEWQDIVYFLEKALGVKAASGNLIFSPLSNNMLSEMCYEPCYRNLAQFIKQYQGPKGQADNKNLKLKGFKETYPENSLNKQDFIEKGSVSNCTLKWLFG